MHAQRLGRSMLAGGAGAAVLTAVHETARHISARAPRMDIVAIRGIEKALRASGRRPPRRRTLRPVSLVADLISNAAYYALVGIGSPQRAPYRGALLGLAAGAGALLVPERIGLGRPPHSADRANQLMTLAWYTLGGTAAGVVLRLLAGRRHVGQESGRSQRGMPHASGSVTKHHGDDLSDAIPTEILSSP